VQFFVGPNHVVVARGIQILALPIHHAEVNLGLRPCRRGFGHGCTGTDHTRPDGHQHTQTD